MTTYRSIEEDMNHLLSNNSISTLVAYRYSTSCSQSLLTLLNMWMYNDQLASYVAFQDNGFAYLLDKIAQSPVLTQQDSQQGILADLNDWQEIDQTSKSDKKVGFNHKEGEGDKKEKLDEELINLSKNNNSSALQKKERD